MLIEPFLLGFSTGWYCLLSCGLYLVPFLFSEDSKPVNNAFYIFLFLFGRFTAYIIIGGICGSAGEFFSVNYSLYFSRFSTFLDLIMGIILIAGGIYRSFSSVSICKIIKKAYIPSVNAFIFGIITGLSICPPFVIAITEAFRTASVINGIIYFVMFYLGTSIYFLPLFGVKFIHDKQEILANIARAVMILIGLFFIIRAGTNFLSFYL